MNYTETLDFLFSQLPMFQRIGPVAFKKDLGNIQDICTHLHYPEKQFNSLHIAGTNGKGSVSHMLAAVFQSAGYKTGLYTSPHLKDFRERIKINGEMCTEQFVIDFVKKNKGIIEQTGASFFEITVAMAFDYFAKNKVDIALIETGLGGRLDSTNIIQPLLSVITNIGLDHQQFLGDSIKQIASEKAGIIKENIPVVIGESHEESLAVFREMAKSLNSKIVLAESIEVKLKQHEIDQIEIELPGSGIKHRFKLDSGASYQAINVRTAYAAIQQIRKSGQFNITNTHITSGLGNFQTLTNFQGRWHVLQKEPFLILADCAHNLPGLQRVMHDIAHLSFQRKYFVIGTVNDKDYNAFISCFPKDGIYYCCKPDIPRGLDAETLAEAAKQTGRIAQSYRDVHSAVKAASQKAVKGDLVYIGGSIFVVAEAI
jgi:dihydrofolate synthase / folylpolyglutamate synthase